MKIELKSVKVFAAGSEETTCFVANIYIDGKKRGEAKNDGHGGSTYYHLEKDVRQAFEAYAATLPDKVYKYEGEEDLVVKMNGEVLIDDLLEAHLRAKESIRFEKIAAKEKAKHQAAGFAVTVQIEFGDRVLWCACKAASEVPGLVAHMARKHKMSNPSHKVI